MTGSGFSGATAVNFGSLAATSFSVTSATTLTAVSPAVPARARLSNRIGGAAFQTPLSNNPTNCDGARYSSASLLSRSRKGLNNVNRRRLSCSQASQRPLRNGQRWNPLSNPDERRPVHRRSAVTTIAGRNSSIGVVAVTRLTETGTSTESDRCRARESWALRILGEDFRQRWLYLTEVRSP